MNTRACVLLALLLASCGAGPKTAGPKEYVFFPDPPDKPRIQFLLGLHDLAVIETGPTALEQFVRGTKKKIKGLSRPYGVAAHNGCVYVLDGGLGRIVRLDLRKRSASFVPLTGRARVKQPSSIAFAEDGEIYITDTVRGQVIRLNKDWGFEGEIGPWPGDSRVVGLAVHGDRLYVTDTAAHCLRVVDRHSGEPIWEVGQAKDGSRLLHTPGSVTVDENGYCYVAEVTYCKIFVWDKDGKFVTTIGQPGRKAGTFSRPKGIALASDILFVTDAVFCNCQLMLRNGACLMAFGQDRGEGSMLLPSQIWVGKEGLDLFKDYISPNFNAEYLIIVSNLHGANKVAFYALGKHKKFKYEDKPFPKLPMKETMIFEDSGSSGTEVPDLPSVEASSGSKTSSSKRGN